MKLDYKVLLTLLIIISLCIVGGLLLFGAIGSNPVASAKCNPDRIDWRCMPHGEPLPRYYECPTETLALGCEDGQRPDIQPKPICPNLNLNFRCPLEPAGSHN